MSPTHAVFTLTMISLVALVGGVADADAPDVDHRGQAIGTIRSIDRAENVVTLGDGLRLRATDAQILDELREGELVKVDPREWRLGHPDDRSGGRGRRADGPGRGLSACGVLPTAAIGVGYMRSRSSASLTSSTSGGSSGARASATAPSPRGGR